MFHNLLLLHRPKISAKILRTFIASCRNRFVFPTTHWRGQRMGTSTKIHPQLRNFWLFLEVVSDKRRKWTFKKSMHLGKIMLMDPSNPICNRTYKLPSHSALKHDHGTRHYNAMPTTFWFFKRSPGQRVWKQQLMSPGFLLVMLALQSLDDEFVKWIHIANTSTTVVVLIRNPRDTLYQADVSNLGAN